MTKVRVKLSLTESSFRFSKQSWINAGLLLNIHALTIITIVMNLLAGNIRRGVERMELAHDKDPVDPMVLNHLGNHFFFTGQHFLVEQLTETALENGRDHPLLKSQAYYNLARSYHSKVDSLYELPLIM